MTEASTRPSAPLTGVTRPVITRCLAVVVGLLVASVIVWSCYESTSSFTPIPPPMPKQSGPNPTIIALDWTGFNIIKAEVYAEKDCVVTQDRSLLGRSDAVVITHGRQADSKDFPQLRHSWQRWIWQMDESPQNAFVLQNYRYDFLKNLFNWTMTYKKKSDVYIPYGWTTRRAKPEPIPSSIGNRTKVAFAVISNCDYSGFVHNSRYKYILQLQKFTNVDLYGRCAQKECGKYYRGLGLDNCKEAEEYLFYLAFENSNCSEYITEKTFAHGFSTGAVPVVMGASKEDYIALTPPNSFIYANDFAGPSGLGVYLTFLSENKTEYMKYHKWRENYFVDYRAQYIHDRTVWKALCKALRNDKGEPKVYRDLEEFWTTDQCSTRAPTLLTGGKI